MVQARLPAGQHRELLDLGGEREEPVGREPVVERLDAEPVARGKDRPGLAVVEHEREHAVEPVQAVPPPLGVGVEEHLGVGAGVKGMAGGLELGAQLAVVVDLAVVDDPVAAVGRAHRLVAGRREVEDGEPAVAERDADRSCTGGASRAVGEYGNAVARTLSGVSAPPKSTGSPSSQKRAKPSSSGPRWRTAAVMARTSASVTPAPSRVIRALMPHM